MEEDSFALEKNFEIKNKVKDTGLKLEKFSKFLGALIRTKMSLSKIVSLSLDREFLDGRFVSDGLLVCLMDLKTGGVFGFGRKDYLFVTLEFYFDPNFDLIKILFFTSMFREKDVHDIYGIKAIINENLQLIKKELMKEFDLESNKVFVA